MDPQSGVIRSCPAVGWADGVALSFGYLLYLFALTIVESKLSPQINIVIILRGFGSMIFNWLLDSIKRAAL